MLTTFSGGISSTSGVTLRIALSDRRGIYRPGEKLTGDVVLESKEDLPICGIYLWVLGQSDVSWSGKESRETHFDYEIYMKECLILWNQDGSTSDDPGGATVYIDRCNSNPRLSAGSHRFSFEYALPATLPSSFDSHDLQLKARVHYLLRVKLDSTDPGLRHHKDQPFVVLRTLDLNREPEPFEGVEIHRESKPCWCFCQSGPVTCSLRLDRTGFVPGEDASLDVDLQNASHREITSSYVAMKQIVTLHAEASSRSCTYDIFCISGGKVKAGENAFYHDIIHIPPLPPSRLEGCSIIDVNYVIRVGVLVSGSSSAVLELTVPIVIGTVPLKHTLPPGMHLLPTFQRYCHSTGEIEDYSEEDYIEGRSQHVYLYYKCRYDTQDTNTQVVTVIS